MRCPKCGGEMDVNNYCSVCCDFFYDTDDSYSSGFDEEPNYDSMVNDGSEICLNCTYWTVSPYGRSHGMYCRKGNGQTEPDDTCFEFVQSHSFANYGDGGEFQFDETSRDISNKLDNWRSSRY